jgi:predicted RNase H-like HicB family nuclease
MALDIIATVHPEVRIVLEHAGENWSAYVPGIPGVAAAAETQEECRQLMEEALTFHIEGLALQDAPELFREAAQPKGR